MQSFTTSKSFEKTLRDAGYSVTLPRRRVFEVLKDASSPLSTQEIIGVATETNHFVSVYRSIDVLLKAGIIKKVPIGFKNKFELSDKFKPHHHHAVCESCGKLVSMKSAEIENIIDRLISELGFRPTHHNIEAYGVCAKCRNS